MHLQSESTAVVIDYTKLLATHHTNTRTSAGGISIHNRTKPITGIELPAGIEGFSDPP